MLGAPAEASRTRAMNDVNSPPASERRFLVAILLAVVGQSERLVGRMAGAPVRSLTLSGGLATPLVLLAIRAPSEPIRWSAVLACCVLVVLNLVAVLRSGAHREMTRLDAEKKKAIREKNEAVTEKNEALAEAKDALAQAMKVAADQQALEEKHAQDRSRLDRSTAYSGHVANVIGGLGAALDAGLADGLDFFVESNILVATRETMKIAKGGGSERVSVELGIVTVSEGVVRVTHSAGAYMEELKASGGFHVGSENWEDIFARKAAANFGRDGWDRVPFSFRGTAYFLIAFSDSVLDDIDHELLKAVTRSIEVSGLALAKQGASRRAS